MNDVDGKTSQGIYRYYAKGESKPFTGILYSKFPNGQTDSWQQYIDGVGQGEWINYYDNGNYREIGNYDNNLVSGPMKKYYRNGNLKSSGTYKNWRIKVGKWKYYNSAGEFEREEDYGVKGSLEDVEDFYERGEISYQWYSNILKENGFIE